MEGKQIHDIVEDLHCEYIDVKIEVEFKRRQYADTRSMDMKTFLVIGVLITDADDYHHYTTNLREISFSQRI